MLRRLFVFVATLCLCLSTLSVARADDYPAYVPGEGLNSYDNDNYMVAPVSNGFNAALWLIGENDKYPQLTDYQLARLSNEGTGGAFYDLAVEFTSVADSGIPSWAQPNAYISSWGVSLDFSLTTAAYGDGHVWYVHADAAQISNARRDFLKVYNGESTGAGMEQFEGWYKVLLPAVLEPYSSPTTGIDIYENPTVSLNDDNGIGTVNGGTKNGKFYYADGPMYMLIDPYSYNLMQSEGLPNLGYIRSFGAAYALACDGAFEWVKGNQDSNYRIKNNSTVSAVHFVEFLSRNSYLYRVGPDICCVMSNCKRQYEFTVNAGVTNSQYWKPFWNTFSGPNFENPTDPPKRWPDPTPPEPQPEPDPPEVPQPPELPTPWNPTIPEPDPPDPINPYTPIVEPEPTGTTPTDYTPWLRAILAALNRIIVDLANHCEHIQNAIRNASTYLVGAIGDYAEYLAGKLHYELTTIIADLESYLADLAQWLADELDFDRDAQVYDDARLLRILLDIYNRLGDLDSAVSDLSAQLGDIYVRLGDLDSAISDLSAQLADIYVRLGQILAKIGSGGGRPAPTTEPEVDEGFDFWQWLLDLISSKLDAIIEDFVGDIGGFLSELVTKFPFSIPWDIAAYLTLLDAQRVTPVISFVIPAIGGWWGEVPITVDLQPYDNAMAAVRSMMLILWGFCLIMRTDWLGGVFDGAVQAVTSFFDRLTGHGGGA